MQNGAIELKAGENIIVSMTEVEGTARKVFNYISRTN